MAPVTSRSSPMTEFLSQRRVIHSHPTDFIKQRNEPPVTVAFLLTSLFLTKTGHLCIQGKYLLYYSLYKAVKKIFSSKRVSLFVSKCLLFFMITQRDLVIVLPIYSYLIFLRMCIFTCTKCW